MQNRTTWVLGAVIVVLVIALLAVVFLGGGDDSGSTTTSASTRGSKGAGRSCTEARATRILTTGTSIVTA